MSVHPMPDSTSPRATPKTQESKGCCASVRLFAKPTEEDPVQQLFVDRYRNAATHFERLRKIENIVLDAKEVKKSQKNNKSIFDQLHDIKAFLKQYKKVKSTYDKRYRALQKERNKAKPNPQKIDDLMQKHEDARKKLDESRRTFEMKCERLDTMKGRHHIQIRDNVAQALQSIKPTWSSPEEEKMELVECMLKREEYTRKFSSEEAQEKEKAEKKIEKNTIDEFAKDAKLCKFTAMPPKCEKYPRICQEEPFGETMLHHALETRNISHLLIKNIPTGNRYDVVSFILQNVDKHIDLEYFVNRRNKNLEPALFMASQIHYDHKELRDHERLSDAGVIRLLLNAGADISAEVEITDEFRGAQYAAHHLIQVGRPEALLAIIESEQFNNFSQSAQLEVLRQYSAYTSVRGAHLMVGVPEEGKAFVKNTLHSVLQVKIDYLEHIREKDALEETKSRLNRKIQNLARQKQELRVNQDAEDAEEEKKKIQERKQRIQKELERATKELESTREEIERKEKQIAEENTSMADTLSSILVQGKWEKSATKRND
jgi:predicted  nucleic acid-binding Zn-ribbon protein